MEGRPWDVPGRGDPREHRERREAPLPEGLAEQDPRRLVVDPHVDADGFPLGLQRLLEDLLPHDIVWRNKEQFDEGSGTVDMLQEIIKTAAAEIDPVEYAARYPQDRLRSAEECYYHKLLVEAYEKPEVVLRNVGRWHNREEEG